MNTPAKCAAAALVWSLLSACNANVQPTVDTTASARAATATAAAAPSVTTSATAAATAEAPKHALSHARFAELIASLSEADGEFFSDNYISNETSYLQVAKQLQVRKPGGVYIGVGPEQNFTYIAHTKPDHAYIVDIRRDNLVLQLLYKATFDLARSRGEFLALLTGRAGDDTFQKNDDGDALAAILDRVMAVPADDAAFEQVHKKLRQRVESYGVALTKVDIKTLHKAHRSFFGEGVDIRFKLKTGSFRKYPSLRELLVAKSPDGKPRGFLATADSFHVVQEMQRQNRIIPLVGNFAGDGALPALAKHLTKRGDVVRSFYVSNVEQYLLADGLWWKWQRNIEQLPSDADSVFIRAYLDQGKAHPRQLEGHRTATTLHRMEAFKQRKQPYPSMHALSTDGMLARVAR